MDMAAVGRQIVQLRKGKGLTQSELGDRLGVSFQAVSKWERAETLPDTALLLDLAAVLETTVDNLLSGGRRAVAYVRRTSMDDLAEGLRCLERMGALLGRDNLLYRAAVEGIGQRLDTEIEPAFSDGHLFQVFVAEAAIQALRCGAYVDPTDVKAHLPAGPARDAVLDQCRLHGIK